LILIEQNMAKTPAATVAEVKTPATTPAKVPTKRPAKATATATPAKIPAKATKVQIKEPEIKANASKTKPAAAAARPEMPAKVAADPSMKQLFTSTLISASTWDYFASPPSNSLKVCTCTESIKTEK
jgi:hypothetical protein